MGRNPADLEAVLDRIDEIIDRAYFTPLGVGDALSVQFRAPGLKGLPLETTLAVLKLIDELDPPSGPEGEPDPEAAVRLFMKRLQAERPEVHQAWAAQDPDLVYDPVGAFTAALSRARPVIDAWVSACPAPEDEARDEREADEAVGRIMAGFGAEACPDDQSFRRELRQGGLAGLPDRVRPEVYLECWSEFVRAVLGLEVRPETARSWPY